MVCRKVFKGLVIGGLLGVAIIQILRRRAPFSSDEAVTELRFAPSEQPTDPIAVDVPAATDIEPQVTETESVETEPVDQKVIEDAVVVEESSDDVRATVIDIDAIAEDEQVEPDDLRKIEGIGPKISDILNGNGIYTYAQLAGADVDELRTILVDAGSRFRLADPTTWPQQAQLAADGDWDGLQAFQDSLKGGKES